MTRRRHKSRSGRSRKGLDYAIAAAFLLGVAVLSAALARLSVEELEGRAEVRDGDSIEIGGVRIRLEGIDAPELLQQCTGADGSQYGCGVRARQELSLLVGRQPVICNGWNRDVYDRLLARCEAGGRDIGRAMVRSGWAVAYGEFQAEEAEAERERAGMWAGDFMRPRSWRELHDGSAGGSLEGDLPAGGVSRFVRRLLGG